MERNTLETVLGAVVLLVAGYFLYLVYSETNVGAEASGYPLELRFDSGGSTGIGTDVRIAGVKVGSVIDQHFDEQAYQAVRRCWRYGQAQPVTVDIVTTEGGARALANIRRKAAAADAMFDALVAHMNDALHIDRATGYDKTVEVPPWA